jgi:hypothetical protein
MLNDLVDRAAREAGVAHVRPAFTCPVYPGWLGAAKGASFFVPSVDISCLQLCPTAGSVRGNDRYSTVSFVLPIDPTSETLEREINAAVGSISARLVHVPESEIDLDEGGSFQVGSSAKKTGVESDSFCVWFSEELTVGAKEATVKFSRIRVMATLRTRAIPGSLLGLETSSDAVLLFPTAKFVDSVKAIARNTKAHLDKELDAHAARQPAGARGKVADALVVCLRDAFCATGYLEGPVTVSGSADTEELKLWKEKWTKVAGVSPAANVSVAKRLPPFGGGKLFLGHYVFGLEPTDGAEELEPGLAELSSALLKFYELPL